MRKQPKTGKEIDEYIRGQVGRGTVTNGEFLDSDMDNWLRSRGQVLPERKKPMHQLTPEDAVKILEMMAASGMTFTQAKAKYLDGLREQKTESDHFNSMIRQASGRETTNEGNEENSQ